MHQGADVYIRETGDLPLAPCIGNHAHGCYSLSPSSNHTYRGPVAALQSQLLLLIILTHKRT